MIKNVSILKSLKTVSGRNGLDGVERVLYKLPQVLQGIKNKEKVYFVEGEKDVETLLKKGKLATCIPGRGDTKMARFLHRFFAKC